MDAVDKALENNEEQNLLSVRYNVQKILETEGVRNRGYNTAVNTLTNVLDTSNKELSTSVKVFVELWNIQIKMKRSY